MDLDTFIRKLSEKKLCQLNIFIAYDKFYAEYVFQKKVQYLNVDGSKGWEFRPEFELRDVMSFRTIPSKRSRIWVSTLNIHHYSIIRAENYNIFTGRPAELRKIIEDVYDGLPSKVDIYRYKNDYDLSIFYL